MNLGRMFLVDEAKASVALDHDPKAETIAIGPVVVGEISGEASTSAIRAPESDGETLSEAVGGLG